MANTVIMLTVEGGRMPTLGDLRTLAGDLEGMGLDVWALRLERVESVEGRVGFGVEVPDGVADVIRAAYTRRGVPSTVWPPNAPQKGE